MDDLISRQAAIDAINQICPIDTEYDCTLLDRVDVRCVLTDLLSAQPEVKEIGYAECANAMLKMWIDNVLTDGEYNRIMDKLNKHEMESKAYADWTFDSDICVKWTDRDN